ncbi:hypothetical protein [Anaerosacchariphilus polymeriproducens]|uniref:Uncharacterized protein n=1 Tax=Anaerosacchariphilus polymeriproducens TaxID=1812858 RepID=A0A371ARI8_9FIRM|nr:hypothetical protein [Anaerosacchariphilus polymeriproducens]RDU22191.1 hypothetical protein DWV06_16830 [Anaerosacchariphilus polymeriproducens]
MFFNSTVFKRLVNQAWKGAGLTVGRDQDEIFLEGGFWVIRIKENKIPNKDKAALIEIVGELPAAGEVFKAIKGTGNQYEIPFNHNWNLESHWKLADTEFGITNVIVKQKEIACRVLQNMKKGNCVLINEIFMSLIDLSAMNREEETEPFGPMAVNENGTIMYWKNQICALAVCTRRPNEENYETKFMDVISRIDLETIENI